ncbi:MAG: hypothetical protein M3Z46_12445 [Actinomycetota bacterium]|nr:hypothetical protein [Actinomycetota bacterium]
MRLRLVVAASATCLAVLAPALQGSLPSTATTAAVAAKPSATSSATSSVTSSPKVLDGTLVEVHAQPRLGSRTPEGAPEQWLRTADGKAYQLDFTAASELKAHTSVQVTGTVSGNKVAVVSAVPSASTASAAAGTSAAPSTSSTYSTSGTTRTGVRSVLIMMVDWTKPDATTPAAAKAQIGVTTNNWYRAVSSNKLGFSATATPWMTLAKQDCSLTNGAYWKVLAAAENAAVAHGYNPKAYDHEMVYFPFDANCNYGGLGSVSDRSSWVNGEMDSRVANHELGHNLGLNHARSAVCVDSTNHEVTASSTCTTDEYGDLFDTMGVPPSGTPQISAIQMNHLGWLTGHFTTTTSTSSVTLSPLESGTGTRADRILVGGSEYWLEYRQPVGVDATLKTYTGATDGVLIHRVAADGGTDLLDATPDAFKSFADAALPVGRTWTSPEKVSVKVTSISSARAVVSITMPK